MRNKKRPFLVGHIKFFKERTVLFNSASMLKYLWKFSSIFVVYSLKATTDDDNGRNGFARQLCKKVRKLYCYIFRHNCLVSFFQLIQKLLVKCRY